MNEFVSCIVAAGGSGTRMGANKNKLFLEINDVPVIAYTLLALEKSATICNVIISARKEDIKYLEKLISEYNLSKVTKIVEGGETRGESVLSASEFLSDSCEVVVVHDGARPFVTEEIIKETVKTAEKYNASACGVKPKCTLKAVEAGMVANTIDREKTIEIQTPQAFKKQLFCKMYSLDADVIKVSTDDCMLAEKCGAKIHITPGSYRNIKITTPEDLEIAEIFLRRK